MLEPISLGQSTFPLGIEFTIRSSEHDKTELNASQTSQVDPEIHTTSVSCIGETVRIGHRSEKREPDQFVTPSRLALLPVLFARSLIASR